MPQLQGAETVLAVGLVLALASIVGDLLESAVKRSCGVKDSSRLFPGHGGLYDRFDSLFFAAPVAVSVLELLFWGGLGASIF